MSAPCVWKTTNTFLAYFVPGGTARSLSRFCPGSSVHCEVSCVVFPPLPPPPPTFRRRPPPPYAPGHPSASHPEQAPSRVASVANHLDHRRKLDVCLRERAFCCAVFVLGHCKVLLHLLLPRHDRYQSPGVEPGLNASFALDNNNSAWRVDMLCPCCARVVPVLLLVRGGGFGMGWCFWRSLVGTLVCDVFLSPLLCLLAACWLLQTRMLSSPPPPPGLCWTLESVWRWTVCALRVRCTNHSCPIPSPASWCARAGVGLVWGWCGAVTDLLDSCVCWEGGREQGAEWRWS